VVRRSDDLEPISSLSKGRKAVGSLNKKVEENNASRLKKRGQKPGKGAWALRRAVCSLRKGRRRQNASPEEDMWGKNEGWENQEAGTRGIERVAPWGRA